MRRMSLSRVLRVSLGIAGISLAGFHGWLFLGQIAAGRFDDPWVIFRWSAAALLVAAFAAVRRAGDSMFGRRGIAIWVLAALLHGPAIAADGVQTFTMPEAVAASVLQIASSLGLAAGLWILTGLLVARRRHALRISTLAPVLAAADPIAAGITHYFSPRPPPLRG
jgi:hypothetical protein